MFSHKIKQVKRAAYVLLTLLILCSAGTAGPENNGSDESTIKALFLYNFTKQIEWPSATLLKPTFIISIYGESPVKEKLQGVMKGRKVFDKAVEIKVIANDAEIEDCHMLFLPKSQSGKLMKIVEQYADKGILIITEEKGIIGKGSGINIIEKDEHLRFEINEAALKKQGLKISNQLYNLASNRK